MFLNLFQLTAAQSRLFFAALTEGNCNSTLRRIWMSNCEVTDAMALELVGSGKENTLMPVRQATPIAQLGLTLLPTVGCGCDRQRHNEHFHLTESNYWIWGAGTGAGYAS